MTCGLDTTFEALRQSSNEAAGAVLLKGLESSEGAVRDGVLKTLVGRRKKSGHLEVLKRWHLLTALERECVLDGRGQMSGALRDAVLSEDDQLFSSACEVVEECSEYDLVPTLVTLAENQQSKHAAVATVLVQRLVARLSEGVHGPRDYSVRRDPQSIQRFVLESLERSVQRFRQHQRNELIEAFVVLAGHSSSMLSSILDDPRHVCYLTVINTLTTSRSPRVIDFLIGSLRSNFSSANILNIISKRNDPKFVAGLLEYSSTELSAKALKNIGKIRSFAWLQRGELGFDSFDEEQLTRCVKLVAASGVKQDDLFELLETVLKIGGPESRTAACDGLAPIPGARANQLVLDSVGDADPNVQAACVRQLRDRHLAGTKSILLKMIDSPHEMVREASREALSEFTFANFLVGYEAMNDDSRRVTAVLVKKVDLETPAALQEEMAAQSRKRRMRAIEMAQLLGVVPKVADPLMEILEDEDHVVRAAAAEALQYCPTPAARKALKHAMTDRSGAVQHAAQSSLAVLSTLSAAGPEAELSPVEGRP